MEAIKIERNARDVGIYIPDEIANNPLYRLGVTLGMVADSIDDDYKTIAIEPVDFESASILLEIMKLGFAVHAKAVL